MVKSEVKIRAVGGVTEEHGKFVAFFELHSPCHGGSHGRCTVKRRDEMEPRNTFDEAAQMLADVHREVGWESEHDA